MRPAPVPFLCAGLLLGCQICRAALADPPPAARPAPALNPQTVEMGAFFDGARVHLEGVAEAGEQVIVVARGAEQAEDFNRKRRWGPIWISSGRVHVTGGPSVWLLFSSGPVGEILKPHAIRLHRLDRASLTAPVHVAVEEHETSLFRSTYFDLKRSRQLYAEQPGTVQLRPSASGAAYTLDFAWPRTAPPGSYRTEVYFCRNGEVVGLSEAPLKVVKVGLPKTIAELSTGRASLYGILCILAAAAAGFGMDRVVGLMGGKRHAH